MKWSCLIVSVALAGVGLAQAATLGEVGMHESFIQADLVEGQHESLFEGEMLDRWSVGIDFMQVHRKVTLDGGQEQRLRARVYSFQLGMDLVPWLMAYGTAGASQAELGDAALRDESPGFKWSGGLRVNWWHVDVADPTFLAGRLSFQSSAEFAQYQSRADVHWNEGYADLTVHYEVFVDTAERIEQYPYSVVWFGGPAVSTLKGKAGARDFSEANTLGAVGGLDLYLSHNLALGAQIEYLGTSTFGASLRYHF